MVLIFTANNNDVRNNKNNGSILIANKKFNFLSLKLNLIFDFELRNKKIIKKGINIPICLIKNIEGYFK